MLTKKHPPSIEDAKQNFDFHAEDRAKPKLRCRSSFATHVSSTTGVQPKNVLHISVRSTSNTRSTDSRTINSQNKKNSEQKQSHITSSTVTTVHHQKLTNNDCIKPADFSDTTNPVRNTRSTRSDPVEEHHRSINRNKIGKYLTKNCCQCSCLQIILSLLAALLLGIAITAALVGALVSNKTTTTTLLNTSTTTDLVTTEMITTEAATTDLITTEAATTDLITTEAATTDLITTEAATTDLITTEAATTDLITTGMIQLTTTNEIVYGIWNTTVGGDSTPSTAGMAVGNYYPGEIPNYAFDNQTNTKYTSFGTCALAGASSLACGLDTGLYLTSQRGPSLLLSLQFCTGNDLQNRDPFTITVEGSNQSPSLLTLGSSWTLIYNGSTGLELITNRYTCGVNQSVSTNSIRYSGYRILVTSKRTAETCTQYSEVKLMGYQ